MLLKSMLVTAILYCGYVTAGIAVLDDTGIVAPLDDDIYPQLASFMRIANDQEEFTLTGKYMMIYGVPGNFNYYYNDFQGKYKCGQTFPKTIEGANCYINQIPVLWAFCSEENNDCTVKNGSGLIRFGEGQKYYFFPKSGLFGCDYRRIGDPSPGVAKHCGLLYFEWAFCSDENTVCTLDQVGLIRFGREGNYLFQEAKQTNCNLASFGGDPINGTKNCRYLQLRYYWIKCATGDEVCKFFGISIVKFTEQGKKDIYKQAAFEIRCQAGKICLYASTY